MSRALTGLRLGERRCAGARPSRSTVCTALSPTDSTTPPETRPVTFRDAAHTAVCIPRPWTMVASIFSPVGGAAANKENDFSCSSLPTLTSLSSRMLTTRLDTTTTTSANASPLHLLSGQRTGPGHECRGYPQHLSPSALRSLRVHLLSRVLTSARPAMQPFDLQRILAPRKSSSARDLPTPVSFAVPRHGQSLPEGASVPRGWGADSRRWGLLSRQIQASPLLRTPKLRPLIAQSR